MGKISKALDKYAGERKSELPSLLPSASPLTHEDIIALVAYDEKTGHLLKADPATGSVDEQQIEALRASGTILRLLENKLIYPGGKLTAHGVEEARRLAPVAAAIPKRQAAKVDERGPLPSALKLAEGRPTSTARRLGPEEGDATAVLPPIATEEDFIEAYAASPDLKPIEPPPPAAVSGPLKVVSEPKHADGGSSPPLHEAMAKKSRDVGVAHMWDEAAIDPNLVALTASQSLEAEQFKILRTNILFPLAGSPPRSILVTSTAPREGKTFAAANLAISIALNINRHVLLIDADMRIPQLHKRFGFGPTPGLSDYLAKGSLLPSLLLKTKVDKLTLLPAGPPPDNPAELIGAERMASLLAEVTNRYPDRIVVIDAPPPAMAAETGVLARQVDGILVVVRYGSTRREDLADLVSRVGEKKILGSVVNYIETNASRYYGYKYGGYGRSSQK